MSDERPSTSWPPRRGVSLATGIALGLVVGSDSLQDAASTTTESATLRPAALPLTASFEHHQYARTASDNIAYVDGVLPTVPATTDVPTFAASHQGGRK